MRRGSGSDGGCVTVVCYRGGCYVRSPSASLSGAAQTSVPLLTTAVSIGASVSWLELAGLNVSGGTDAGLRYAGGYSPPRGLVEVADAANVALSNCSVSQARQQQQRGRG